jgi:radical SAM protein with 4Fe4S-binding SPASM domain
MDAQVAGMSNFVTHYCLPEYSLWERAQEKRVPLGFDLEITARCNNDCRHCYINLSAGDQQAMRKELSLSEIDAITGQAVEMGTLWVLITGGEPLLRKDFFEIYQMLKKKGLLVSVFTNACLVTHEHITLFKHYPPRNIEVSVYGTSRETYEAVTRKPGSYAQFRRGLDLLLNSGVKVRLKAMALRSNVHELPKIASFCREYTCDYFRFDPLLHLRYDGDPKRNVEIMLERLSPDEIVVIEEADEERSIGLQKSCSELIKTENELTACDHLFHCGAGKSTFSVSYDGYFRLCSTLHHPLTVYNLRQGTLAEAWNEFTPRVQDLRSSNLKFLENCRLCPIVNLCQWCPANAHLECGQMDGWSEYFCQVAHARAEAIKNQTHPIS